MNTPVYFIFTLLFNEKDHKRNSYSLVYGMMEKPHVTWKHGNIERDH